MQSLSYSQVCRNCNIGPAYEHDSNSNQDQPIINFFNDNQQTSQGARGRPIINHYPHGTQYIPGNGPPIINYFGVQPPADRRKVPQGATVNYFPADQNSNFGQNPNNHNNQNAYQGSRPSFGPECQCVGNVCSGCNVGR